MEKRQSKLLTARRPVTPIGPPPSRKKEMVDQKNCEREETKGRVPSIGAAGKFKKKASIPCL